MDKTKEFYDVVIIGGGSAGLTAGIYCGRAKLNTLIIEKSLIGGLATYTNEVENYPGFPEKITGTELMNLFHKQAKKFGVKFKQTPVRAVNLTHERKTVETFRNIYEAKAVIIASGGKPRLTNAPNEEKFLYGKGISFCATCDAAANIDKTVMVVGNGDSAIEEGIFLTKFAKKVIVSVTRDVGNLKCHHAAKEEAFKNKKMEFIWNTRVHSFESKGEFLEKVILKNTKNDKLLSFKVDTCFLFIGYNPDTEIFKNIVNMTSDGYIPTNEKMETNIKGVYCVGDARNKSLRQISTAVNDGAIAGYYAEKYISENGNRTK
ncbi:FAD-binding protein [Leptotrichia sp. OH3620_COT-345]|uniref:NAD(P)/FAD-dependent oxidoreductase n=1 Tax=Leptotrichia sp. OH3620_COT-345 TaxID=2491048 RepID=UPI000F65186A|nr:FAD-dependent oxidoreductase [Leptotrichia sp. OH3620_COT-345]RRD39644.1 FAD-binding protein [Leptotrichia sp. OH3620_COT-345]